MKNVSAHEVFKDDKVFQFIKKCGPNEEIFAISIIDRFNNKRFMLQRARISDQIWKALSECIPTMTEKPLKQFYIEDSYVDDRHWPYFITKLTSRRELRQLTFLKLELGPNFIQAICKLLNRHAFLDKIRFVKCTFRDCTLTELMSSIAEEYLSPSLRSVSLINMELNDSHLDFLFHIIDNNRKIKNLDISLNRFSSKGMLGFLKKVQSTDSLNSLTLAWNSLKSPLMDHI